MSSDSSFLKLMYRFPYRQASFGTNQGGESSHSRKQSYVSRTLTRGSTLNLIAGNDETNTRHGTGYTPPLVDTPQPHTINVVLFGETGVGKSSVINLIARKEVAKVSSDVNGCTMQSTRYNISFDDMDFTIFDTIGLEEPQMGVNGYLRAIEKAYELIVQLSNAGGIHLLLFCMRGGRITATTQSNYRLFCECLCNTKVPIALVFTGLEREVEMEDWWTRNKTHIEHYGIKSNGHACITAVQDDTPGEDLKFTESQRRIRELLKICALENEAFLLEAHSWFARLGRGMKSFIEKRRNPKKRDVVRVLTHRCKLDPETARKIAEMMAKGDAEAKDGIPDEQAGNREAEGRPDPLAGKGENEDVKKSTQTSEGEGKNGTAKEDVARDRAVAMPRGVEAGPHTVEGKVAGQPKVTGNSGERRPERSQRRVHTIATSTVRPSGSGQEIRSPP